MGNQKVRNLSMLGIARGSKENGGLSSRGGRTRITNVSREEFSVDSRGFSRGIVVNLRRSNVWRHEIVVVHVGAGRGLGGRRPARRRERTRRYAPDEELDEDTCKESDKHVDPGELSFAGGVFGLL